MTAAGAIADATRGTPWEGRLWIVGGAVRDELLGLPIPPDIDIVLETDALELASFLHETGVSTIAPVTYPRFGTALVRVQGAPVELVTARKESYGATSRKPKVARASLREDALRRDFTINTLMRNLHTGEIIDPLETGLGDLRDKLLKTPLDPEATFHDDPLRMLRAVRFKNRFGLSPAPGLLEAIRKESHRLEIISGERIRDELVKMLLHPAAADCMADLMDLRLLDVFASEFREGIGVDQGGYHTRDVWGHTLDVVRNATAGFSTVAFHDAVESSEDLLVALGALLHDIAKPRTRTIEAGGRVRFFGHEKVGAKMAFDILRRLRFSGSVCTGVSLIVRNHMRLGSATPFTLPAARRLVRDMGGLVDPLLRVCEADAAALRTIPKGTDFADIREKIALVQAAPGKKLESPLDGEEIMSVLNLQPGPEVKKWKARLTEAVLDGLISADDKDEARRLLRQWSNR
jgi:poly(A) polymerase